jgi:hypothetical protein
MKTNWQSTKTKDSRFRLSVSCLVGDQVHYCIKTRVSLPVFSQVWLQIGFILWNDITYEFNRPPTPIGNISF